MKNLLLLLFILGSGTLQSQNLYTNAPKEVYPILEKFIHDTYDMDVRSFEKINKIDSITVEWLDYPLYGVHTKIGNSHTIKIHKWLLKDMLRFERTLKHELGHVFGLPHIDIPHCYEIMASVHYEEVSHYYAFPENWKTVNDNYYKSLQTLKK